MNIIRKSLFSLLALGHIVAIQAMDSSPERMYQELAVMHHSFHRDVELFNEPVHGHKARSIFYRSFGFHPAYLKQEDHITKWIPESLRRTAYVLSLNQNVIGVVAYYDKENEDGTTTRLLDRLTIDEKHRGTQAGHAQFLMQKFEEKTMSEGITDIQLVSYKRSLNFYQRLGYEQTSPLYDMQKTLKPRCEDEKCIVL